MLWLVCGEAGGGVGVWGWGGGRSVCVCLCVGVGAFGPTIWTSRNATRKWHMEKEEEGEEEEEEAEEEDTAGSSVSAVKDVEGKRKRGRKGGGRGGNPRQSTAEIVQPRNESKSLSVNRPTSCTSTGQIGLPALHNQEVNT